MKIMWKLLSGYLIYYTFMPSYKIYISIYILGAGFIAHQEGGELKRIVLYRPLQIIACISMWASLYVFKVFKTCKSSATH